MHFPKRVRKDSSLIGSHQSNNSYVENGVKKLNQQNHNHHPTIIHEKKRRLSNMANIARSLEEGGRGSLKESIAHSKNSADDKVSNGNVQRRADHYYNPSNIPLKEDDLGDTVVLSPIKLDGKSQNKTQTSQIKSPEYPLSSKSSRQYDNIINQSMATPTFQMSTNKLKDKNNHLNNDDENDKINKKEANGESDFRLDFTSLRQHKQRELIIDSEENNQELTTDRRSLLDKPSSNPYPQDKQGNIGAVYKNYELPMQLESEIDDSSDIKIQDVKFHGPNPGDLLNHPVPKFLPDSQTQMLIPTSETSCGKTDFTAIVVDKKVPVPMNFSVVSDPSITSNSMSIPGEHNDLEWKTNFEVV